MESYPNWKTRVVELVRAIAITLLITVIGLFLFLYVVPIFVQARNWVADRLPLWEFTVWVTTHPLESILVFALTVIVAIVLFDL